MDKITVRACPGRTVPIHPTDAVAPGNGRSVILKPGDELEVRNSTHIRRAILDGDLERVNAASAAPTNTDATPRSSASKKL